jgi:alkylation response protein AidB-like acyl-CoA dehydrogenase
MLFFQCYPNFRRFDCKVFLTEALRFMGGATTRVMIDNTHVVVLRGTGREMIPVPEMEAFAERFGFRFVAHERGDANRSARVERPFSFIENNFLAGRTFATVGISHLTTSRQHLSRPVLRAEERDGGFLLDGYSPWVTGAEFAQHIVLGATLPDGRQILVVMPTDLPGVRIERAPQLVGLSASRTGPVHVDGVLVPRKWLLAGPIHEVMKQGLGARTGGSQTCALAIGLASAAIEFLRQQAGGRNDLAEPAEALAEERDNLLEGMLQLAGDSALNADRACVANGKELRVRSNSLALRASQSALAAAKGAGYVVGHPAGRWCREALFFLVWSCPAPVLQANLCELAGIAD